MTVEEAIFVGAAVAVGAASVAAVSRRGQPRSGLWMGLATLAMVLVAAVMRAPLVAGLLFVFAVVWSRWPRGVVPAPEPTTRRLPRMARTSVAIALSGSVAFVLAGTMARQFVDGGVDLSRRPGFGEADGFAHALIGADPMRILVFAALAVVLVLPLAARRDEGGAGS